jgi:uncharacterized membrane protein
MKNSTPRQLTAKQKIQLIAIGALLWIPMMSFIIWRSDKYSERQIAGVAAINMLVMVPLYIYIGRRYFLKSK